MSVAHENPLVCSLAKWVDDQLERLIHLTEIIPEGWHAKRPPVPSATFPDARTVGELLVHLTEALDGLCGTLYNVDSTRFASLVELRANNRLEVLTQFRLYRVGLTNAFETLADEDLAGTVPSPFRPEGETVLARVLVNLEHVINHKHELFVALKLLGLKLRTVDLYRFD
jgi:hypothetical protein